MEIGLYRYAISLFTFLALVAWSECDGSPSQRIRCWIMVALVMAYQLSTSGRLGALLFIFSLLWIVFFRGRRIAIVPLVVGAITLVAVFASAAILLNKGGNREAGLAENITGVFDSFLVYLLGGSVAFNEVVTNPAIIRQDLFTFFYQVANALGANFEVWRLEPVYVATPEWTNVFTLYMSVYAQFGFLGVVVYMLLLGGTAAWLFKAAERGSPWATVFSAQLVGSLLLTGATDPFLPSTSLWIQLGVFCWLVYKLPGYWLNGRSQFRRPHAATFRRRYARGGSL
jgi:oligosaccharide repeat unit polymerase